MRWLDRQCSREAAKKRADVAIGQGSAALSPFREAGRISLAAVNKQREALRPLFDTALDLFLASHQVLLTPLLGLLQLPGLVGSLPFARGRQWLRQNGCQSG
jgi:hypothetical protein